MRSTYFYVLRRLSRETSYACPHQHPTHAAATRCGKDWVAYIRNTAGRLKASFKVFRVRL